jgi:hypothetical protein
MGLQPRRLAVLSFGVSMLVAGLECASAGECDYKTCGALMARDASTSWAVSGRHDYSPDTKRACAEFNACVRRAKSNSAGRGAAVPPTGSSSLKSSSIDATAVPTSPNAQGAVTQPHPSVTVGNSPATIGSVLRASCGPDVQKFCAGGANGKRRLKVPGFSAHGPVDNLQLVFPEIGRAIHQPKERSEQKAAIAGANHANSSRGECSEQTGTAAATNCASPKPGKCPLRTAAVAASN